MIRRFVSRLLALGVVSLGLAGCAGAILGTSPLGRTQMRLIPAAQMDALGAEAYAQIKQQLPQSSDERANRVVRCVSRAVVAQARGPAAPRSWEVTVFENDTPNAFALPGGKIGVHTGLLKVARDPSELATVIGHEVAHVLAQHGNERASTAFATQKGLELIESLSGPASPGRSQLLAVLGLGAQVGITLPFGRTQEREADLMGLDLMADAGFDPRASVALWQNMARAGGGAPPEFLSTHPAHGTRIRELEARIPAALQRADAAHGAGRRPRCS
ncbi:MAG: M48 family metallopeptidase [Myxococcota bacterium]